MYPPHEQVCTPPTIPTWLEELDTDDPLAEFSHYASDPSDEKYERITIKWVRSDTNEPVLEQYYVDEHPYWKSISPKEAAKLREELNSN